MDTLTAFCDGLMRTVASPQRLEAKWKEICQGVWGDRSPYRVQGRSPGPGRGSGRRSPPEAEIFLLNYMIILTFLIMKKCNMFACGIGQRAIQGNSCQFHIVHDCRAEERVNNPHVYTLVVS